MQQIMPPPVKDSALQSGRVSKKRFLFLITTALVGSGLGLALGSTVRFHMVSVGNAAPLFKPQQDFPPLAKWPPEVPFDQSYGDLDTGWEVERDVPQLVYKGPSRLVEAAGSQGLDDINGSTELESTELSAEETAPQVDPMGINVGTASDTLGPDNSGAPLTDDRLSSDVITGTETLPDELPIRNILDNQQRPFADTEQWIQTQPASIQPLEDNASVKPASEFTSVSEEFID